ncbi:MAG: sigma-54 dependent transcriptional regulator [Desulfobacteraceae bacterium]|jgi:two-component system NtrC family response regulator
MSHILIIDDDPEVCTTMESMITRMGMSCLTAASLTQGLEKLEANDVDVVFLDVRLPDGDGLTALPRIKDAPSQPEVIILTGQGDPDGAELAIQGGVWDYLVKPSPVKQTRLTLQRAIGYRTEKQTKSKLVALNTEGVIGNSPAMRKCFDVVAMASQSNFSVLITGETGTGKELFARTIHRNSKRNQKAFIVVDCAALPEHLMESILFGHKKGAFTSANQDRSGLVKQADGGTLLLDEIGELNPNAQKVFLRVLQERKFRPVGARSEISSDFRLMAATNRDLPKMVEKGRFREDLFYRLKAITLNLPPLRKRQDDIKALTMYYINYLSERAQIGHKGIDADLMETLKGYTWPGNIRELFHSLEQAFVASGDDTTLFAMHLPSDIRIKVARSMLDNKVSNPLADPQPSARQRESFQLDHLFAENPPTIKAFKLQMEKAYLEHLITTSGGDVGRILKTSKLSRSHFYALLKRHGIAF